MTEDLKRLPVSTF